MSLKDSNIIYFIILVFLVIMGFVGGCYYHKQTTSPIFYKDTLYRDTGSIVIKEKPIEIVTKGRTITKWDTLVVNKTDTIYSLKKLSSTVDTSINQTIEVVYKDTLNNINDTIYYQNSLWFYANYKFPEDIMTIKHQRTYDTLNLYSFTRIKYYDTSKDDFTNQTWFKVALTVISFGGGVYVGSFK